MDNNFNLGKRNMDWSFGTSAKHERIDALGKDLLGGPFCGRMNDSAII